MAALITDDGGIRPFIPEPPTRAARTDWVAAARTWLAQHAHRALLDDDARGSEGTGALQGDGLFQDAG
ncbi:MAG: hypothetical protein Q4G34_07260, partial [Micrococcus sp.]|nr:hypothetical protein [Micrococcus sp.]